MLFDPKRQLSEPPRSVLFVALAVIAATVVVVWGTLLLYRIDSTLNAPPPAPPVFECRCVCGD